MKKEIKYVPYGIACRVGNTIYINERLKSHRKLYNAILKHEKNHTEDFAMKDILLDIHLDELNGLKREYYKFIISNPSSWVEFLPIKKYGNTVLFNLPVALMWLFAFGLGWYGISSIF